MLHKVFSVRDTKAEIFNSPFHQKTHGEAERTFRQLAKDEKTTVAKNPEDFILYYLGDYDDNTGLYRSLENPQQILRADALNG